MSGNDVAPPAARRTIVDLPTELKALIARMARDQDLAYKERSRNEAAKLGANGWSGKSLNGLFLVDREWSALAATLLFKHISPKGCNAVIFKSSIVRRFADKIQHVSFRIGGDQPEDSEVLLSALRHLSNLNTITLGLQMSLHLLGVRDVDVEDLALEHLVRRQELRDAGRSVHTFEADRLFAPDLLFILKCFPALTTFKVSINDRDADDDTDDLTLETRLQIFAGLSNLRNLTLDSVAMKFLFVAGEPLVDWGLRWSLCRLEVHLYSLDQLSAAFTLAQHSAGTLISLEIRIGWWCTGLPSDDKGLGQLALPHLGHLHIGGTWPQVQALLPLFKASPITSLNLVVDPPDASALLDLALQLLNPQLERLRLDVKRDYYDASKSIKPALQDILVSRAAQHGVALVILEPRYDVFADTSDFKNQRRTGTARRCDGVDEVLRFGMAQSARIRAVGDVVAAGELVEALRPMHARMLRQRD